MPSKGFLQKNFFAPTHSKASTFLAQAVLAECQFIAYEQGLQQECLGGIVIFRTKMTTRGGRAQFAHAEWPGEMDSIWMLGREDGSRAFLLKNFFARTSFGPTP